MRHIHINIYASIKSVQLVLLLDLFDFLQDLVIDHMSSTNKYVYNKRTKNEKKNCEKLMF